MGVAFVVVCGMVIACVKLGRWPVWGSLWLRVGERRDPSSVRLAFTSVGARVVELGVASDVCVQLPM